MLTMASAGSLILRKISTDANPRTNNLKVRTLLILPAASRSEKKHVQRDYAPDKLQEKHKSIYAAGTRKKR